MNRRNIALVLCTTVALSACATKAPKQLPPDPGANSSNNAAGAYGYQNGNGGSSSVAAPGTPGDFNAQMMGRNTIYFDTDKYNIDSEDIASLTAQAQWLMRYPSRRATIEGHCDERGTREYNLALGERRANAAKDYLVSLGVGAERLSTVSYGKERPVALGSDEASWAKNRRAVTVTID
jgi:peptidoglycan-associated lipoprotein